VNVGLSFLRGLAAAVNPCAFVLLPTYLMYFLGMEAGAGGTQRSSVRRALLVSAAVSAGFVVVFVVAGVITNSFTSWLAANAKYVTVVIGVTLVVLGAAMLFGYRLPLTAPAVGGGDSRTVRSMFVYGVGYALASLGCTIALFMSTAFASPDSFTDGMVNVAAFAAGMALIVTALTVSLAVANRGLLRVLRSAMRYVDLVAAAFVLLSGLYLVWYFWVVDVNGESDAVTDAVERVQVWVFTSLNDHWELVAIVLTAVVAGAIAYVAARRAPRPAPEVPSPGREHQRI
jgi:cytochrome c biogenesis protein CcdA